MGARTPEEKQAKKLLKAKKKLKKQQQLAKPLKESGGGVPEAVKAKKKRKRDEANGEEAKGTVDKKKDKKAKKAEANDATAGGNSADASAPGKIKKRKGAKAGADNDNGAVKTPPKLKKDKEDKKAKKKKEDKKAKKGKEPEQAQTKASKVDASAIRAQSSDAEVAAFLQRESVAIEGTSARPVLEFSQVAFPNVLSEYLGRFQKPSPIQSATWPICLSGQDVVGIAQTGSGKTLAFGMPALTRILRSEDKSNGKLATNKLARTSTSVMALILAPTRELAQQIATVFEDIGATSGVRTALIYGGMPKGPQRAALQGGAKVVVATPGRLRDLLEEGALTLANVLCFILDEADRMLDLGFEPDIRAIAALLPKTRQTLMFSATWPQSIQQLAAEFLDKPAKVTIGSQELAANHRVEQHVEVIEDREKEGKLKQLLNKYHSSRTNRVLVFVLYKKEAVRVERMLQNAGWKVASVHGDKAQGERNAAVETFRKGTCPLLVATDVAARGLDIPNVSAVINYSFPLTTEDYVHRIGRTGRAGQSGISHTLFTSTDKGRAGELVNVLKEAGQHVPPELLKFGTHVKKKEHKLYGAHFNADVDMNKKGTKITFDD